MCVEPLFVKTLVSGCTDPFLVSVQLDAVPHHRLDIPKIHTRLPVVCCCHLSSGDYLLCSGGETTSTSALSQGANARAAESTRAHPLCPRLSLLSSNSLGLCWFTFTHCVCFCPTRTKTGRQMCSSCRPPITRSLRRRKVREKSGLWSAWSSLLLL